MRSELAGSNKVRMDTSQEEISALSSLTALIFVGTFLISMTLMEAINTCTGAHINPEKILCGATAKRLCWEHFRDYKAGIILYYIHESWYTL